MSDLWDPNNNKSIKMNFNQKRIKFNGFILRYVLKSIRHNLKRSLAIFIAIVIAVSLTTALIMWIETSPRLAVRSAMQERAFEIRVHNPIHGVQIDALDDVQTYINESEPLVEATFLVQRSVFLYNLNDRPYNFSLSNPPENESDFFISEDFNSGVFLVDEEYLEQISKQVSYSSPLDNFTLSNNGIVISKRLLRKIELTTNQTLKTGDKIDFAVATRIADPERGEDSVRFYNPILFYNLSINAVFDRKVQRNLMYPYFYPESLGDGIFIPRNLFNHSSIKKMEAMITPYLFIRFNRESIANMNIFSVSREIEALAFRVETKNVFITANVYIDEIDQILSNYENSQVIILFLFIPLIIIASIFFTVTTSHILDLRKSEIELLRIKGNPFRNIMTIFIIEFAILSVLGILVGVIGGYFITLGITASDHFLDIIPEKIPTDFLSIVFVSWYTWALSAIVIELVYILIAIQKTRGMILKLQGIETNKVDFKRGKQISKRKADIFVIGMTFIALVLVVQSDIVNRLSIDYHLMGLYLACATILWLLLSNRLTHFSSDFLVQMSRITRILFKAKTKIISMSIVRKRAQVINIVTLIILTVSLGIFSVVYAQSIDNNTQRNLNYLIGSDFKVFTEETSTNYTDELEKIEGISVVSSITQTSGNLGSYSVTLVGINPRSYSPGCYWSKESVLAGGTKEEILNELEVKKESGIIINDYLASTLHLSVGDNLNVTGIIGYAKTWNFVVSGILESAPGMGKLYSPSYSIRGYAKFGGIIIINQEVMKYFKVQTTRIFLVKSNDNNPETHDSIRVALNNQPRVRQVLDRQQNFESFFDFMKVAGVAGILSVDFLISLFIAIIGVSIFYNYIITIRLKEYAILRACGGTKNQILWISISETILIISFGILFGFMLGLGYAIGFMLLTQPFVLSGDNIFRLEFMASPFLIGSIVIIEFCMLLLSSGLATNKARNVNVSNLLRNL